MGLRQQFSRLGPSTRARDLDREAALVGLREALVDGQLTQDEFDLRSAAVLRATRVGELTKITEDLQSPPPEAFAPLQPQRPRWQRIFGPALVLLVVGVGLFGIEALTRIGTGNDGIEDSDSDGGFGFPGLDFPGQPELHTADGMTQFIDDLEERFGTTETMRAVIYPEYVVIWQPQTADPSRLDTFYYDGGFDDPSPSGTRDLLEEPLVDLADLDVDAMALLVLQAPAAIGVAEPENIYVIVEPEWGSGDARLAVYVSDDYVSGYLNATMDGTVTDVYEAS